MSDIRFAVLDNTYHVTGIFMADPSYASQWYLVPSETAEVGDVYDPVNHVFSKPIPPKPTRGQMIDALNAYLSNKETARRELLLDGVLGTEDPQTMAEFQTLLATADPS